MAEQPPIDKPRRGPPQGGGSPYKGDRIRVALRLPKDVARKVQETAAREDLTFNDVMVRQLSLLP